MGQIRGASVSAQDAQRGSVREPVKHELTVRRPTDHMPVILACKPAMRGNRRRMMCVDRRSPSRVGESDLYVVAEVVIFAPLLFFANTHYEGVIQDAAIFTMILFAGLTAVVFLTGKNFSFLGGILGVGMIAAIGFLVMSMLFGFHLPMLFTCLMILLACGYILYETSNVLHTYNTKQHVAASLALFAAVALLFWYLLQLFMRRD